MGTLIENVWKHKRRADYVDYLQQISCRNRV